METLTVTDLSVLTTYHDRQVVINYYQDEEFLYKRDGLFVQTIDFQYSTLSFYGNQNQTVTILLDSNSQFYSSKEFQNYYILKNRGEKIEIYFP